MRDKFKFEDIWMYNTLPTKYFVVFHPITGHILYRSFVTHASSLDSEYLKNAKYITTELNPIFKEELEQWADENNLWEERHKKINTYKAAGIIISEKEDAFTINKNYPKMLILEKEMYRNEGI